MTVLQVFFVIAISIIFGRIFSKYASDIILGIIYVGMSVFLFPMYIYMLLIRGYNTLTVGCNLESKIIRKYDKIFSKSNNMESVMKINRKIRKLKKRIERKQNKENKKLNIQILEDYKWII